MHKLKNTIAAQKPALGMFLTIGSPLAAEALGHVGFDFLFLDMQHGTLDTQSAIAMMMALRTTDTTAVVRVPGNDIGTINRVLDYGAQGIVCPLINNRQEAENLVHAVKYPPLGGRSWGPIHAAIAKPDYAREANENIMAIAMIETLAGYENLADILKTPGLDAILTGPSDLGFSFGNWPQAMPDDPEAVEAIRQIARQANECGVLPGIHCGDVHMARDMFALGYKFASVGVELGHLIDAAGNMLDSLRSTRIPLATADK